MTFTTEIADTLSVAEAAAILGCHPNTVRVRLQKGQLPGRKINTNTGPQWRVFRSGPFAGETSSSGTSDEVRQQEVEPDLRQSTSLAQVSSIERPATLPQLPQPGVVEALDLLRESLAREEELRAENARLRENAAEDLAAMQRVNERINELSRPRPLAIAEAATEPLGFWDKLDRWWFRFIRDEARA